MVVVNTVYSAGWWKPGIYVIFLSHHNGCSCLCLLGIDCLWERGREGGREEGREGGRKGGREGGRKGGREGGREEGRMSTVAIEGEVLEGARKRGSDGG